MKKKNEEKMSSSGGGVKTTTTTSNIPKNRQFQYVLIPAENSSPIQVHIGDKEGGLTDDMLVKEARKYFYEQQQQKAGSGKDEASKSLSPAETKFFAEKIRRQATGNTAGMMSNVDDETLVNMMRSAATDPNAACEITALTVPTELNKYFSVSMYSSANTAITDGTGKTMRNDRATALLEACGHSVSGSGGIRGDVFVGRCRDDEIGDVWERVDFVQGDVNPESQWCREARRKGGGGGRGGGGMSSGGVAPSLSGVMANAFSGKAGGGENTEGTTDTVANDCNNEGGAYKWTQTDEEVELKFAVPNETKSTDVMVKFARKSLQVSVSGIPLLNGITGGDVSVEESTFTIQDDIEVGRELCITLGKEREGDVWVYAVRSNE